VFDEGLKKLSKNATKDRGVNVTPVKEKPNRMLQAEEKLLRVLAGKDLQLFGPERTSDSSEK